MKKITLKLAIILVAILSFNSSAFAYTTLFEYQGGTGFGGLNNNVTPGAILFGNYGLTQLATSSNFTFATSSSRLTVTNASTTVISSGTICLTGDICRTTWPSSSSFTGAANSIVTTNGSGNEIATGTQLTVGNIIGTTTASSFLLGKFGIGTSSPNYQLNVNATAISGREAIMTGTVSDAPYDAFYISNNTSSANRFSPQFSGFENSGSDKSSMNFDGFITSTNDTGTQPVMQFDSELVTSVTDPLNNIGGALTSRPLYAFNNNGTPAMILTAANRWGMGTSTPLLSILTVSSSTAPQLTFSDGTAGDMSFTFRNAGGTFYLSTTTATGLATTSISALEVSGTGFGTTTVRGLNISAQATTTSNVGMSITTGCYAIGTTCISGGGGSGTVTSVTAGAGFQNQGLSITTTGTLVSAFASSSNPTLSNVPYATGNGDASNPIKLGFVGTSSIANGTNITVTNGASAFVLGSQPIINLSGVIATSLGGTNNGSLSADTYLYVDHAGTKVIGAASSTETCSSPLSCTSFDVLKNGGAISLTIPLTVAQGGTNKTSYPINSILTTDSAGTSIIATSSQLTTGSLLATSTLTNSVFLNNWFGVGTSTPRWLLQLASSTAPQLALSDGTNVHWVFRNNGGTLDFATSSATTFATTTGGSALELTGTGIPQFGIGTTTAGNMAILSATRISGTLPLFAIASSTATGAGMPVFELDTNGHQVTSGQLPTVGTCGTNPVITGNDVAGSVLVGTGASNTACTITFAKAYIVNATFPLVCQVTMATTTVARSLSASTTATALLVSSSISFAANRFMYSCIGTQ